MKKLLQLGFLLLLVLAAYSCQKEDAEAEDPGVSKAFERFQTDNQVILGSGGSETITLSTSGDWTLSSDAPSWLSFSPASGGPGETLVTVTSKQNDTKASRNATVTFKRGRQENQFTIRQRANVVKRVLQYSGRLTLSQQIKYNTASYTLSGITALLAVPPTCIYQDVSNFSCDYEVKECPDRINRYVEREMQGALPPSGSIVLSESCDIHSYYLSVDFDHMDDPAPYRKDTDYYKYTGTIGNIVMPNHPGVTAQADRLWTEAKGNPVTYARKCYEWTAEFLKYERQPGNPLTMSELMESRTGDCSEYATLLVSLLRAKGIPARHVNLKWLGKDLYHAIAEFYIPGYGWIPMDASGKNQYPNYNYFGTYSGKGIILSFNIDILPKIHEFTAAIQSSSQMNVSWGEIDEKLQRF